MAFQTGFSSVRVWVEVPGSSHFGILRLECEYDITGFRVESLQKVG